MEFDTKIVEAYGRDMKGAFHHIGQITIVQFFEEMSQYFTKLVNDM